MGIFPLFSSFPLSRLIADHSPHFLPATTAFPGALM
jgi:hypothetical protein